MSAAPLPPTKHDHPDVHSMIWTQSELVWIQSRDAQWQAYATAARADLEAENTRLREALATLSNHLSVSLDISGMSRLVLSKIAQAALKEQP